MIGTKKVVGIIAEYNPFHAGHRYHIEMAKQMTGAEYVVVVMSGNFVQRGEPAIVNKYLRTEAALKNGADLVIELPVIYATGSAQYFARGAVQLLEKLGCVDYLAFGSEYAEAQGLKVIADILEEEPVEYKELLQKNLAKGMNFPKARQVALVEYLNLHSKENVGESRLKEIQDMLSLPNHILALEYIQALNAIHSSIEPIAIQRKASGYHEENLQKRYSSATAIRKALGEKQDRELIKNTMAEGAERIIQAYDAGETVAWADLLTYLNYNYLYNNKYLEKYFGMNLELARRMEHNYRVGMHFEEMIEVLHMKNMTDTALKRALLHIVLKIEEAPYLVNSKDIRTPYIRVLGMNKKAGNLIKAIKELNEQQFIQRPVSGMKMMQKDIQAQWIYQEDIMAANLYEQICAMKCNRYGKNEYEQPQIIVERE